MNRVKVNFGDKYNKLTIIEEIDPIIYSNGKKVRRVICDCSCGNIKNFSLNDLRTGRTTSCGCHQKKIISKIAKKVNTTHGDRILKKSTPEYRSWCGMKDRCYREKNKRYSDYGGRGINVCERWLYSFENFIEDMGRKPNTAFTLDRIDNSLGYCKENCRWATQKTQANNRRKQKLKLCQKFSPILVS